MVQRPKCGIVVEIESFPLDGGYLKGIIWDKSKQVEIDVGESPIFEFWTNRGLENFLAFIPNALYRDRNFLDCRRMTIQVMSEDQYFF